MFGFQSLILNLFAWLVLLVPQDFVGTQAVLPTSHEDVITIGHHKSVAIVELISNVNPILDTAQDNKLPQHHLFTNILLVKAVDYEPRLLYFNIGNAIDLQLNSTTIIFPFHCFT